MASPHAKFAALAERLIAKHGGPLTIKQYTRAPADADKPWRAGGPPSTGPAYQDSVDVIGVIIEYDEEDIDGVQIMRDDRRLLVAAKPIPGKALEDFDIVLDGVRPLSIIKVSLLKPGTTLILFDIQVRQ